MATLRRLLPEAEASLGNSSLIARKPELSISKHTPYRINFSHPGRLRDSLGRVRNIFRKWPECPPDGTLIIVVRD